MKKFWWRTESLPNVCFYFKIIYAYIDMLCFYAIIVLLRFTHNDFLGVLYVCWVVCFLWFFFLKNEHYIKVWLCFSCVGTGVGSFSLRMTCPFLISDSSKKTELGSRALLTKAGAQGKKKSKPTPCASQQPNPLDQTCIHPESYNIAMR